MAQNVTIYGNMAVSLNNKTATNDNVTSMNEDTFSSSVIGLKVSEALGGGMKAYVQAEGDFETSATTLFNRQQHVGLSGSFGAIQFGRSSTALDSLRGFGAGGINLFDTQTSSISGKKTGTTRYTLPAISGVTVVLSNTVAHDGDEETSAATNTNNASTEGSVAFKLAGFDVAVGHGVGKVSASDAETTMINVGYTMGAATVFGQSIRNTEGTTEKNWVSAGINYALGSGMTASLNYKTYDTAGETSDHKQVGVALVKALSKRTQVGIAYRSKDVKGTGADIDVTSVGIQHQF
jgi:predicted porin